MEKKPNVFPTKEERVAASQQIDKSKLIEHEKEKINEVVGVYQAASSVPNNTDQSLGYNANAHAMAVEEMRRRTEYQLSLKNQTEDLNGVVQHPELAENAPIMTRNDYEVAEIKKRAEEQMRIRDEKLKMNQEMINKYQTQNQEATTRTNTEINNKNNMTNNQQMNYASNNIVPPQTPNLPPTGYGENYGKNPSNINPYIFELSQPNYNSPFDVLPLPSEGKLYKTKKPSIRVGYMTTSDENILTSPNLLESGQFLEILINRKILEPELRYKDLTVGDRNAIMLWLRATAYGEMYPVTILDENNIPFDTEINLNELKTKKLGAEPDAEGLLTFVLPLSKANIKFKLITCGDLDDIEAMVKRDEENKLLINNSNTYAMERMIVEVNGDRDRSNIVSFINSMRVGDGKKFTEYVESISSGIDLDIEIRTPGGGSVKTFLPLNINFFWPNARV